MHLTVRSFFQRLLSIFALALATGCAVAPTPDAADATVTPIVSTRVVITLTPAPTQIPSPTPLPPTGAPDPPAFMALPSIFVAPTIQGSLRADLEKYASANGFEATASERDADVVISTQVKPGAIILTERVFVVADWFPTLRTDFSMASLRALWQGTPTADGLDSILLSADTLAALRDVLGAPAANVKPVKAKDIVTQLWSEPAAPRNERGTALAIVPFEQLTPKLTALTLDRQNVLSRDLKIDSYPLVQRVWIGGAATQTQALVSALRPRIPITNRDPQRITSLIMTGVTAIARGTAAVIEARHDPAFPARQIAAVLSRADITHISNEIPFADGCTPNRDLDSIVLCSNPAYLASLKLVGADIIGLTGNHAFDFGVKNYVKTLELYDSAGMRYYAGGRNLAEASRALIVEDHGNKLAFLGANSFGPASYWAIADSPGTNGYDAVRMAQEIAKARKQAGLVFVEYQADEVYDYAPDDTNRTIFRRTIADGADVVTGVQNHHPAAVEFSDDGKKIILYGLGNLFFDQMFSDEVRQGLVARHTIYDGRLIQTELLTTMLEYAAQPRWATPAEREKILRAVFAASGFHMP